MQRNVSNPWLPPTSQRILSTRREQGPSSPLVEGETGPGDALAPQPSLRHPKPRLFLLLQSRQAGTTPGAREVQPRPDRPLGRMERGSGRFWGAAPRPPACPEEAAHPGRGWHSPGPRALQFRNPSVSSVAICLVCCSGKFPRSSCPGTDTARTPAGPWAGLVCPLGGGLLPRGCRSLDGSLVCCCGLERSAAPQDRLLCWGLPESAGEGHRQDPGAG